MQGDGLALKDLPMLSQITGTQAKVYNIAGIRKKKRKER